MKVTKTKGSTVRVWGYFFDPDSTVEPIDPATGHTLVDPNTLKFHVKPPTGEAYVKTYGTDTEVEKSSVGVYLCYLPLAQEGTYHFYWEATAVKGTVIVRGDLDSLSEVDF